MNEEQVMTPPASNKKRVKKPKSKGQKIFEWILFGLFGVLFVFVLSGNISAMVHKDENYGESIRFGWGSFVVKTNSMEPRYMVGSAILTYKEDPESIYNRFNNGETIDATFMNIGVDFEFEPDTEEFKLINGGQEVVSFRVMTHQIREVHIDTTKELWHGRYIFVASGINDGGESSNKGQYQVFTDQHILGVVKLNSDFLGSLFGFIASPIGLLILLLIPAFYLIITSAVDIFKAFDESEEAANTGNSGSSAGKSYKDMTQEEKDILKQELLEEMMKGKKK